MELTYLNSQQVAQEMDLLSFSLLIIVADAG